MCLHEWGYLLIASNSTIIFNWGNTSCVNQLQYISILSLEGKTRRLKTRQKLHQWQGRSLFSTRGDFILKGFSLHFIRQNSNWSSYNIAHYLFTFWAASKLTPLCEGRGSFVGRGFWFIRPTAQFHVKTFRGRFDYLFPSFQLFYIKFSILCFVLEQIYFDTQIEVNAPKMSLSLGSW